MIPFARTIARLRRCQPAATLPRPVVLVLAPDPCAGGECNAWDPRGDRPVAVFCTRHCPDCRNPLADCQTHRPPLTADELGRYILDGMGRHRRPARFSEFSSLTDD